MMDSDNFWAAVMTVPVTILFMVLTIFAFNILFLLGYAFPPGHGKYKGILLGREHHGMFWKTDGTYFKTGINSSRSENFCVTDKKVLKEVKSIPLGSTVEVTYKDYVATPSWKCDIEDMDGVITGLKVVS